MIGEFEAGQPLAPPPDPSVLRCWAPEQVLVDDHKGLIRIRQVDPFGKEQVIEIWPQMLEDLKFNLDVAWIGAFEHLENSGRAESLSPAENAF